MHLFLFYLSTEVCSLSDIDDCFLQPCMNKGSCHDLINGFKCMCPLGYDGRTCEIGKDDK